MGKALPGDAVDAFELAMRVERARERSRQLIMQTRQLCREARAIQVIAALKRLQLNCAITTAIQNTRECGETILIGLHRR